MAGPGGIEAGRASIRTLPDLSAFARSLKAYLERIERSVRVSVRVVVDTSRMGEEVRKQTEEQSRKAPPVRVPVEGNTDEFAARLRADVRKAAKDVEARIPLTAEGEQLRAEVRAKVAEVERGLKAKVPIEPAEAATFRRELTAKVEEISRTVPKVTVETKAETGKARAELAVVARDRKATIEVDIDRHGLLTATRGLAGLFGALSPGGAFRMAALSGGMAQLAYAATSLTAALAPASGALLLLPAAGLAAGAAIGTLVIGMQGVGAAMKALASGDSKKAAEAMANLAPAARDTVLELRKLAPAWTDLRKSVQQNLFDGVSGSIRDLGARYLPILKTQLSGMASVLSTGFRATAGSLLAPSTVLALQTALTNSRAALSRLTSVGPDLTRAFAPITAIGSQFLPGLADGLAEAADRLGDFVSKAAQTGQLKDWLSAGLSTLGDLAQVAGSAASAVFGIVKAAQSVGGGSLAGIKTVLSSLSGFINGAQGQGALRTIFAGAAAGLAELSKAFGPLGDVFTAIAPVIGTIAQQLGSVLAAAVRALAPVVIALAPALQQLATAIGTGLVKVIQFVAPLLLQMAQALANNRPLLIAVGVALAALTGPVGLVIAAVAGLVALWQEFGTQITEIAQNLGAALAPVFSALSAAVASLWPPLQQLGSALAGWGSSVLPIIRQVAQVFIDQWPAIKDTVVSVFTNVVSTIRSAITIITQIIRIVTAEMTWLWNNGFGSVIIGIVKGGLSIILGVIKGAFNIIAGLFKTVASILTGNWSGAWAGIKQIVSGAFQAIGGIIRGAGSILSGAISGLVGLVTGAVGAFVSAAAGIGKAIVDGIVSGIQGAAGAIGGALKDAASGAMDHVKGWLHINSPSRRFRDEVGVPISTGIAFGITKGAGSISSALTTVLRAVARTGDKSALAVATAMASQINRVAALRDAVTSQLSAAQKTAAQLRKDAIQYAHDAAASIVALGDVTKAGDSNGATTFEQIATNLQDAIVRAKTFAQAITSLVKLGLNRTTLAQIVQAGADGGLSAAQAILSAGKLGVAQVNTLQAQLTQSANAAGSTASSAMYAVGIRAADGIIAGLRARQSELTAIMRKLGQEMIAAIRHELGIHSPSAVFAAQVGAPIGQGIAAGITGQAQQIAESLAGVVNARSGQDLVSRFVAGLQDTSAVRAAGSDLAAAVRASVAPTVTSTPSVAYQSSAGAVGAGSGGPVVAFTGPIYARDDEAVMRAAARRVSDALEFAALRGLVVT